MYELATKQDSWDLDKQLNGCLAGYQTDPSYGAAVYFGLEALWGIARDVAVRANTLDPDQADAEWIIDPCLGPVWSSRSAAVVHVHIFNRDSRYLCSRHLPVAVRVATADTSDQPLWLIVLTDRNRR